MSQPTRTTASTRPQSRGCTANWFPTRTSAHCAKKWLRTASVPSAKVSCALIAITKIRSESLLIQMLSIHLYCRYIWISYDRCQNSLSFLLGVWRGDLAVFCWKISWRVGRAEREPGASKALGFSALQLDTKGWICLCGWGEFVEIWAGEGQWSTEYQINLNHHHHRFSCHRLFSCFFYFSSSSRSFRTFSRTPLFPWQLVPCSSGTALQADFWCPRPRCPTSHWWSLLDQWFCYSGGRPSPCHRPPHDTGKRLKEPFLEGRAKLYTHILFHHHLFFPYYIWFFNTKGFCFENIIPFKYIQGRPDPK